MLHELNAEGNQLKGMPMGALKLRNLVRLKVRIVVITIRYNHSEDTHINTREQYILCILFCKSIIIWLIRRRRYLSNSVFDNPLSWDYDK